MSLGYTPVCQSLTLSAKSAFTLTLTPATTPYPAGLTAWIEIYDSTGATLLDTWTGTVTTSAVTWLVPPASTNPIPAGARYRLYAQLPGSPSFPEQWYYGPIVRAQ